MAGQAVVVLLFLGIPGLSHDVITTKLTWNREISRVIYKRCASCHRDGGSAISLMTYDEARPWAKAIRDQVVARTMPPWGAVKGVGAFQNDPSLAEIEIQMFVAWVEGGAPKGDDDSIAPNLPPVQPAAARRPVVHNPVAHNPVAHNPVAHNPVAHNPVAHNPVAHNPVAHNPVAHNKVQPVAGDFRLDRAMALQGIQPEDLDGGESMLVDAWLPDGQIEHLIWLRGYRKPWTREYLFRSTVKLPAGTIVHVKAPPTAKALLLF